MSVSRSHAHTFTPFHCLPAPAEATCLRDIYASGRRVRRDMDGAPMALPDTFGPYWRFELLMIVISALLIASAFVASVW